MYSVLLCATAIGLYATRWMPFLEALTPRIPRFVDPVPNPFKRSWDFSLVLMLLLYASFGSILFELASSGNWFKMQRLLEAQTLICLTRSISLLLLPLTPPDGTVLLWDPIIQSLTREPPLRNDLFYSGHTAFVIVDAMFSTYPYTWVHWTACLFIPLLLFLQRVHYTIDIFIAPFMAYTCAHLRLPV